MYISPKGHRCFLVALEGADRLGKSTQAKLLEEALEKAKVKAVIEKCPYEDGVTYDRIYEMLYTGEAVKFPVVFQTLQGANRRYFLTQLETLAWHFDVVVMDRWITSTWIYGTVAGVPLETTACILDGILDPDLVFVFDGDPFPPTSKTDSYEANASFQQQVQERYLHWIETHPDIAVRVKANRKVKTITDELVAIIKERFRL
jgi:thymidylate kinase